MFRWRHAFVGLRTPFLLKGTLTLADGVARGEGRLPLASILFFGTWLSACTSLGLGFLVVALGQLSVPPAPGWIGLLVIMIGWGIATAMYLLSVPIERRRLLTVYAEVKDALSVRAS